MKNKTQPNNEPFVEDAILLLWGEWLAIDLIFLCMRVALSKKRD